VFLTPESSFAGGLTTLPFIEEHRISAGRERQRDDLSFARIELFEGRIDFRRWSNFQPIRAFGKKLLDGIPRGGGPQLAMYGFWYGSSIEQLRQDVQLDQNQVVEAEGYLKRRSSRRAAIEIAAVPFEIIFVVGEVRLTLLQERLRSPERQPEHTPDLLAAERSVPIALQSNGFERAAGHVPPRDLQSPGDIFRQLDGDSRCPAHFLRSMRPNHARSS
jgi:hypothetical protein